MQPTRIYRINPVITAATYAAGDQLGPAATRLPNVVNENGIAILRTIHIVDKAKQSAAIDVVFWNALPTVTSTDKSAFSLSDVEVLKFAGVQEIATTDYNGFALNSVGTVVDLKLILQAQKNTANELGKDLWVTLVSRGTPTYASTSDLALQLAFEIS